VTKLKDKNINLTVLKTLGQRSCLHLVNVNLNMEVDMSNEGLY